MKTPCGRNWHEPFLLANGRAYDVLNCRLLHVAGEVEWRCIFEVLERRFCDFGEIHIEYSRNFCDHEYLAGCDCRRGISGAPFATILRYE